MIDPNTLKVIDRYGVGRGPQHIVPSWDLETLWVTGSAESHTILGSLAAIDPRIGKLVEKLPIEDAYNMYFTPDGISAILVAESRPRLEYRDPHTMKLQGSLTIPQCVGLNHADQSLGLEAGRVHVSPLAGVITPDHKASEARSGMAERIGSTSSGTGSALVAHIERRLGEGSSPNRGLRQRHGRDLYRMLKDGRRVVVEGTQGFGLSVFHGGHHPFATSRDTTVATFWGR